MDINKCIKCSIENCKYNYPSENYCTLSQIKIGTHEANPTVVECTDCESFELK